MFILNYRVYHKTVALLENNCDLDQISLSLNILKVKTYCILYFRKPIFS